MSWNKIKRINLIWFDLNNLIATTLYVCIQLSYSYNNFALHYVSGQNAAYIWN